MADILVFGAHPDDAEFGMGASMVKFVRSGASVTVCVLSRGEGGTFGTPEQREGEMRAAARKLGGEIEVLSFRDCQIFDSYESRIQIAQVVRAHRPRLVFAPYHTHTGNHRDGGAHPDHAATGIIVRSALRYARFAGLKDVKGEPWNADHLVYYMVPRARIPSLLNDVSEYMDEWEGIARCHESQMSIRDGKILEFLRAIRAAYGGMMSVRYAEGFVTDDPIPFDLPLFLKGNARPPGAPLA
jgi:LmbE family N-acetylglucosaminyl deacetylase